MTRHLDQILFGALLVMVLAGSFGCDGGVEDGLPAVPTMMTPANGAADQPNALELQWHPAPDAETYHVQLAATPEFAGVLMDARELTTTFVPVKDLNLGAAYYWHVRAQNEAGFSDWSPTWSFTPSSVAAVPKTYPVLTVPANGAESQPTTITFRWQALEGATAYHIQVALEPDFLRRVADMEGVRATSQKVTALVHTYTYYWRIRASNPAGYGAWSPPWNFVVE